MKIRLTLGQTQLLATFLLVFGVSACAFRQEKQPTDLAGIDGELREASFAAIQTHVMPRCIECHTGPKSPHGIDLSSFESITRSPVFPPLVIPGNPEKSSLYTSMKEGRMPKYQGKLPEVMIQAVYTWIKNGAKQFNDSNPTPSPSPTGGGSEPGDDDDDGPSDPEDNNQKPGEPCDSGRLPGEPGVKLCSNEPR